MIFIDTTLTGEIYYEPLTGFTYQMKSYGSIYYNPIGTIPFELWEICRTLYKK